MHRLPKTESSVDERVQQLISCTWSLRATHRGGVRFRTCAEENLRADSMRGTVCCRPSSDGQFRSPDPAPLEPLVSNCVKARERALCSAIKSLQYLCGNSYDYSPRREAWTAVSRDPLTVRLLCSPGATHRPSIGRHRACRWRIAYRWPRMLGKPPAGSSAAPGSDSHPLWPVVQCSYENGGQE